MRKARALAELQTLRNVGPVTAEWLWAVGIASPQQLSDVGAVEAFQRIRARYGLDVTIVLLYALEGAIFDEYVDQIPEEVRAQLRSRVS